MAHHPRKETEVPSVYESFPAHLHRTHPFSDYIREQSFGSILVSKMLEQYTSPPESDKEREEKPLVVENKNHLLSIEQLSCLPLCFQDLPLIPKHFLQISSPATQVLRRKLMRKSNVLIVQGGYSAKRFIYDRLQILGVNVYIMDHPTSLWNEVADRGAIAQFIPMDFTDYDGIFERCMNLLMKLGLLNRFDAVTTYYEDGVLLAARIATALGLETNSVEACENARNKRRTREVMAEKGLPVPRFRRIMNEKDIESACSYVGFPLVLKPAFGAASMGVTRIDNMKHAISAYKKLMPTFNVNQDSIWAQGTEMLIEEYYDGDEFDVDVLLWEEKVVYAKVSDNWACLEPWFKETGTNCPSCYDAEKQQEIIKLATDCTLALGFRNGCFHVECRYTSRGARLIEVNARMGGVAVHDANLMAWGVDLVEEHCMTALGIIIKPVIPREPQKFMAECAINAPYSGTMCEDLWLQFAQDHSLVWKIDYLKKKGEEVVGPEDGLPDMIAEIIMVSLGGVDECLEEMKNILKNVHVPIRAAVKSKQLPLFLPFGAHPFC
ncbi:unnamed protein product [Agarophyton chilense]|eukprot:gb/GEZJ01004170.1/.p1 GENE.gb/GEZJ01004170.1/~~gb/GEZJ01004170.1/.p1  ORF type:complete len:551 (-),score=89.22 gb/GEZJ01004170.1/:126-1778(-)